MAMHNPTEAQENFLDIILKLSGISSYDTLVSEGLKAFGTRFECEAIALGKLTDQSLFYEYSPTPNAIDKTLWNVWKRGITTQLKKGEPCNAWVLPYKNKHLNGYCLYDAIWVLLVMEQPLEHTHDLTTSFQIFSNLLQKLSKPEKLETAASPIDKATNKTLALANESPVVSTVFEDIVDQLDESILIADTSGRLCYANKIGKQWLGIENTALEKIKVYDYEKFFSPNKVEQWQEHVRDLQLRKELMANGRLKNYKTGSVIETEVLLRYFTLDGKGYVFAKSKDITQKLLFEKKVAKEERLQEMLLKIAATYINADLSNITVLINTSLKEIGRFVNADRAYIFSYDFLKNTTSNTYEWCAKGITAEIDNLQDVPIDFIPDWLEAHRKHKSFLVEDVNALPDTGPNGLKAILQPQGIQSLVTLPMYNSHRLIGFVGFDSVKEKKKYSEREKKLLSVYSEILVNIDLRQKYQNEIVQQKDRFNRIISSVDLGLFELNANFEIVFLNQSFLRFYSYQWDHIVGENIFEILSNGSGKSLLAKKLRKISPKEVLTEEIMTFDSKGEEKCVFASITKHVDASGKYRYLGAMVDLSPQKMLQEELRTSLQKTKEASKAKEMFLANMSHELRTPLNIINGALTEVVKENVSKDVKFLLNHANAAATHMLGLVNNILDFAKINAGQMSLENYPFNLSLTLKETVSIFSLLADEKGLEYNFVYDKNIHEYVTGDYGKLNQILINIISNSLKFTKSGGVTIQASALSHTAESQTVRFIISDTGIGMSQKFLEHIFEEYQQEILVNNLQSGTGLGMPISKRLIQILGGKISIDSKLGKGTSIQFDLPFQKRHQTGYEQKIKVNSSLLKHKKVLVVEDNFMNALIVERKLNALGATIVKAENGALAIHLMATTEFDLILMDIQMPVMNGVEATIAIRKTYGKYIPIIALTANAFKSNITNYLKSGMNDVLLKPFSDEKLYGKVLKWLGVEIPFEQFKMSLENQPIPTPTTKAYSLDHLTVMSNGDEAFFNEMLEVFISMAKQSMEDLSKAIANNNTPSLQRIAHKLIPSLKDLHFDTALVLADALDKNEDTPSEELKDITFRLITVLKNGIAELKNDFL